MAKVKVWLYIAWMVNMEKCFPVLEDVEGEGVLSVVFIPAQCYHGQYGKPLSIEQCAKMLAWDRDWRRQLEEFELNKEEA